MSTVFKSRWMALLWAAGIVWFAVDYARPDTAEAPVKRANASTDTRLTDASGRPITAEELEELNGGTNAK